MVNIIYQTSITPDSLWKEKLQTILAPHHDADISYAGIFSDYAPGGIHSDGWIDSPQSLGYTFLIPLKFNYTNNKRRVFSSYLSNQACIYIERELN